MFGKDKRSKTLASRNLSDEAFFLRNFMEENKKRSIVKTISWRLTGTLDTMLISYLITGNLKTAASIGVIEVFTKMLLYYFHERIWNKLKFGRKKYAPEYHI